jgi:3-phosphoshikimate 1-carboxyvinyltransferase
MSCQTTLAMPDSLEITPITWAVRARVRPPGSKSITNRALICAASADGTSILTGALDSEDTQVMAAALRQLGIEVESRDTGQTLTVHGKGGRIPATKADLFCANSGTTIRFLTALATLGRGEYRLDGVERMRERPIGDLINALNQLGANVTSESSNGCPPVLVRADGLPGGTARIRGSISSQYLSALLMAAPGAKSSVDLRIDGTLVSQPYVRMTLAVMSAFGVHANASESLERLQIAAPQTYKATGYSIEPDASAASYFWALAAVTGGEVTVAGLTRTSLQGDVAFVDCLAKMGCEVRDDADSITVISRPLHGIDVDMNAISDTVQTLAVVALFANGPTAIRNVGHIRHKETDRIAALANELRKLGAEVSEHADGLRITPNALRPATVETYRDHRMAMSFALAGLRTPGVRIADPGCVAKTFPGYFDDLTRAIKQR